MLTWYLADLKTGRTIEEMPFKAGNLEASVSKVTTSSVALDLADPSCPTNWAQLIDGRRSMLVADDDDTILGAYLFTEAPDIGGPTVSFQVSSLDAIFDRINVGTFDFTEGVDDEADVAAALLGHKVTTEFGFEVAVTKTGTSANHSYSHFEDRKVGDALSELAAQAGGPEYVVRLRWEDETKRRVVKTVEIGPQVGHDRVSTLVEDLHLAQRRRSRSWKYCAVETIATGEGTGESRLMSDTVLDDQAVAAGIPRWELRVSATSIADEDGLGRVAVQAAKQYRFGTQVWNLEFAQNMPGAPRLGADYELGDVVTLGLETTRWDPMSFHGTARLIGWSAEVAGRALVKVTPTFWSPDQEDLT